MKNIFLREVTPVDYSWNRVKEATNKIYQIMIRNSVDDYVSTVYNDDLPQALKMALAHCCVYEIEVNNNAELQEEIRYLKFAYIQLDVEGKIGF